MRLLSPLRFLVDVPLGDLREQKLPLAGGLSYDESVTNDIETDKTRLYIGALVLEALVLTVLWLVGRYFRVV